MEVFEARHADEEDWIIRAEWGQNGADRAAKGAERGEKGAAAGEAGQGKRHAMRGHHGKRGGQHGMRMMGKADTDGDKAISQAEFQTAALARFDAADANKDGQVTSEERKAQRGAWQIGRAHV